jgi:hypothetical protein
VCGPTRVVSLCVLGFGPKREPFCCYGSASVACEGSFGCGAGPVVFVLKFG